MCEESTFTIWSKKCPVCGREIFPTYQWAYKQGSKYCCSYKCFRQFTKKPERKLIIPGIGDTIEIRYVEGIPNYTGKVGVVIRIDYLGQLHGTWGDLVIVPKDDRYIIIKTAQDGETNDTE